MTLHETARALMRDGKGMFIADEYETSLSELLLLQNISSDAETARAYRDLLFTAEGIEDFLSGVVLSEEALSQSANDGTPFYEVLSAKNILVGADVSASQENLKEHIHELRSRAVSFAYLRLEAHADAGPATSGFKDSIRGVVESAKILQSENIVPVVGVDLSTEGPQTAGQAEDALVESLSLVSDALESGGLDLKGTIVAVGFAASGLQNPLRAEPKEVAERTVRAVSAAVPETMGGVAFLSGQESPERVAAYLNFIARLEPFSWPITFSFSRAFHMPTLSVWKGESDNVPNAQSAFLSRLSLSESADAAGYSAGMEDTALDTL